MANTIPASVLQGIPGAAAAVLAGNSAPAYTHYHPSDFDGEGGIGPRLLVNHAWMASFRDREADRVQGKVDRRTGRPLRPVEVALVYTTLPSGGSENRPMVRFDRLPVTVAPEAGIFPADYNAANVALYTISDRHARPTYVRVTDRDGFAVPPAAPRKGKAAPAEAAPIAPPAAPPVVVPPAPPAPAPVVVPPAPAPAPEAAPAPLPTGNGTITLYLDQDGPDDTDRYNDWLRAHAAPAPAPLPTADVVVYRRSIVKGKARYAPLDNGQDPADYPEGTLFIRPDRKGRYLPYAPAAAQA